MYLIEELKTGHPLEIAFRLMVAFVGFLLVGVSAWLAIGNLNIMRTHEKAVAEVISSSRIGPAASKGLNSFNIRLRYEKDGKKRTTEISRSNTSYEVGDQVPIYYLEDTAYKAIAGDFWGMWFHVLIVTMPGLVILFYALRPYKV